MTELRLILLVIGIAIIALVYFLGTRGSARKTSVNATPSGRKAPQLGDLDEAEAAPRSKPVVASVVKAPVTDPDSDLAADRSPEATPQTRPETRIDNASSSDDWTAGKASAPAPPAPDKIVMFHLMPLEGQMFDASAVVSALRAEGLRYGHHSIFHRFAGEGNPGPDTLPVFSVANILKPGSFDLDTLEDTQLKGVSLVLVLPGPEDPVAAFSDMLATGRRLAATVEGRLVDGTGSPVSRQSAGHMREEIINYQHASNLTQGKDMQHDLLQ